MSVSMSLCRWKARCPESISYRITPKEKMSDLQRRYHLPAQRALRCADNRAVGYDFDLVVVGSGPAGQKAAIQAAKLGRRAAVVDRGHMMGGVWLNTGTIPSKTLREAVLYLRG